VHYVGEPVRRFVAESLHQAQAALRDIKVEYEPLPYVLDSDDALAPRAPWSSMAGRTNAVARLPFARGRRHHKADDRSVHLAGEIFIQRYRPPRWRRAAT